MRSSVCLIIGLFYCFAGRGQSGEGRSYYLLVGTYTNMGSNTAAPPKDSTGSKGIYVYRFDAVTGKATFLSHTDSVVNPSYLAATRDGRYVYAATETRTTNAGSLSAFALDRAAGKLRYINKEPSGGDNPVYVSVHHSGRWVAIANYTGGNLSVFPTRGDGGVLPYVQNVQHTGHSIDQKRQEKAHVHSVVFSPDDRSLYAQDLGEDSISIYQFNSAEALPLKGAGVGKADSTLRPEKISMPAGCGPRHLTFHPNGKYAYLIEELGGSIDVFRYYPGPGHLQLLQRIAAHVDTARRPFRSSDIHVSADGRFLYATNREKESNIAIFSIDPTKGTLKTLGYQSTQGKEPRNFTLDPTGRFLLVANQDSNTIIVLKIDKETGLLTSTGDRLDVPSPSCLKLLE